MMGGYGYPPQMIHPHMGAPIGYPYSTMGLNMDMGFPGASYDETGMMKPAAPPTLPIHANEVSTTTAVAGSVPAPPPGPMPPRGPVGPAATWAAPGYPPSMSSYYAGAAYGYSGSAQAPPLPPSSALAGPVTGFNYNSMYPTQYGGAPLSTPYGSNLGTGAGSSGGGNRNRDGGQRRQGSNQTPKNELPENERFTLLCTGIPKYIKEEEMMTHFKAFGRVVQLQVTASDTTPAASADATSTDEKKTYNECLVQFGSFEDAKKCFSSPEAVLNNRFIRIQQSSFNIIPPADVAPATVEELQEIETIQMNKSAAAKAKATGVTVPLATGPPRPRAPRPVVPLGKPAKNKKYIAGITPVSAPATTATTTKPAINTTATESGDSDHADGNNNKESNISDDATATTDAKEGTDGEETGAESTEIDPSSSDTNQTPSKHSKTTRPIVSAAPTKATMALQQQYDDLRKLRGQVDNIWKTKHNLLQGQIDKYHEMITLLSKIPSDKNTSTIEELESKIVDLQSQLRVIQEQQETGTLQAAQPVQQSSSDSTFSGGRGGRGGRGASFGRFGRGFTPYAGRSGGSGRMGGRWHPGGRGGSVASKNMSIDNRPRSLLVPASEWIQLPATFTANVKTHFSK